MMHFDIQFTLDMGRVPNFSIIADLKSLLIRVEVLRTAFIPIHNYEYKILRKDCKETIT